MSVDSLTVTVFLVLASGWQYALSIAPACNKCRKCTKTINLELLCTVISTNPEGTGSAAISRVGGISQRRRDDC